MDATTGPGFRRILRADGPAKGSEPEAGGQPCAQDARAVSWRRNIHGTAIYGLHGEWEVENHGVAPDIEVENDPASVAAGRDPQLEKAVQLTLEALKDHPVLIPDHPPYPDYQKR